jgi:hypothetical protein
MIHIKWKWQRRRKEEGRRRMKYKNKKMRKKNAVTGLIKALPGNGSVNTSQHATI